MALIGPFRPAYEPILVTTVLPIPINRVLFFFYGQPVRDDADGHRHEAAQDGQHGPDARAGPAPHGRHRHAPQRPEQTHRSGSTCCSFSSSSFCFPWPSFALHSSTMGRPVRCFDALHQRSVLDSIFWLSNGNSM